MKKKNNTIRVSYYGIVGIVLLFAWIIGKLVFVSYFDEVDGVNVHEIAASRYTATGAIAASRGTIYSVNGEALAKDVNSYTVIAYVDLAASRTTNPERPRHVVDKEYTANVLSEYLNMSPERILALLNTPGAYQVELGPGGRDISEKLKIDIQSLELPGIDFIKDSKRYYPYGDFASYTLGYTRKYNGKITGELGVESYYNNELNGKDGRITYQRDAYGYQIPDTPVIKEDAESGKDIYLTIDSNIQMYLENALSDLSNDNTFEWATVTVANAKTGAILGSASVPSFDPNKLNITQYNNPLVSFSYEPGSTMKIFSFMAAIEEGIYDGDEMFMSGVKYVGRDRVTDWNNVGWGSISYDVGFTYSSNVAAANLGLALGREKLVNYYKAFGFGKRTGIELADEYYGVLKPTYDLEVANVAFGQGMTTTPIQNIQALTTLANDGVMLRPYIIDKVIDPDTGETIYTGNRNELGQIVSKSTVDKMKELLHAAVYSDDGYATGLKYRTNATTLVGKTGTAQIASQFGGYEAGMYNNIQSFAGIFPYEDPQYIIYISVKKLQNTTWPIANAVRSIVESIAKYKNLDQLVVEQDETKLVSVENYINKDTSESIQKLEDLGLEVVKIGEGSRIIDQYPEKGSQVIRGSKIFLRTNSTDISMPFMSGWTTNEVGSYCNLLGINYNISGYGRVVGQSVEAGTKIDSGTVISFTLTKGDDKGSGENGEDDGESGEPDKEE